VWVIHHPVDDRAGLMAFSDKSLPPLMLETLTKSADLKKDDIKYIAHRVYVLSTPMRAR
jgi:hypothetical protein